MNARQMLAAVGEIEEVVKASIMDMKSLNTVDLERRLRTLYDSDLRSPGLSANNPLYLQAVDGYNGLAKRNLQPGSVPLINAHW